MSPDLVDVLLVMAISAIGGVGFGYGLAVEHDRKRRRREKAQEARWREWEMEQ